jgi:hypothetical protein
MVGFVDFVGFIGRGDRAVGFVDGTLDLLRVVGLAPKREGDHVAVVGLNEFILVKVGVKELLVVLIDGAILGYKFSKIWKILNL